MLGPATMQFSTIRDALWIGSICLQAATAVAMLRMRAYAEFRWFFAYTAANVAQGILLWWMFAAIGNGFAYFFTYWATQLAISVLSLLAIRELFARVFDKLTGLQRLSSLLLQWASGVLVVLAAMSAAVATGTEGDRVITALVSFGHGIAVVQAGLVFLLFAFCSAFSIPIRYYVLGIAVGFGVFASVDLIAWAWRGHAGADMRRLLSLLHSGGYNAALLVWIFYLWRREPVVRANSAAAVQLERWNATLANFLRA
jgi:hypothetical protein